MWNNAIVIVSVTLGIHYIKNKKFGLNYDFWLDASLDLTPYIPRLMENGEVKFYSIVQRVKVLEG